MLLPISANAGVGSSLMGCFAFWSNFFVVSLLLIVLSVDDIRYRILSNKLIVVLAFPVITLSLNVYGEIFIIPAITTLVIGFVLSSINVIGGGDVKLLTVLMLMVPPTQVSDFLLLISLFGLLLIIIGWIFYRQSIKNDGLPYGVAISGAFFLNFLLNFVKY